MGQRVPAEVYNRQRDGGRMTQQQEDQLFEILVAGRTRGQWRADDAMNYKTHGDLLTLVVALVVDNPRKRETLLLQMPTDHPEFDKASALRLIARCDAFRSGAAR